MSALFTKHSGSDLGNSLKGIYPPGFTNLQPAIGGCIALTYAQFTNNPWPNLTFDYLDAGAQITAVGPNGTQAIPRRTNQVGGPTYSTQTSLPNTYLSPGRYTFTGPGGPQVGSFSGTLDVVTDLVVTNNPDELRTVNRNNPLTIRWTGGAAGTYLTIQGISTSLSGSTVSGGAFICIINTSDGSFTVPASIMQQIPATTSTGGFQLPGSFTVTAAGAGARLTAPSGVDVMTANNFWSWQWSTTWQ
jgi:hypothetical protein